MLGFGQLVSQFLVHLPSVLVLLVGLILVATRQLSPRAKSLVVTGCAVLLFAVLAAAAWVVAIPSVMRSGQLSTAEFGAVAFGVGVLLNILDALGLALLIAAVLTGRARPTGTAKTPAGWSAAPQD